MDAVEFGERGVGSQSPGLEWFFFDLFPIDPLAVGNLCLSLPSYVCSKPSKSVRPLRSL